MYSTVRLGVCLSVLLCALAAAQDCKPQASNPTCECTSQEVICHNLTALPQPEDFQGHAYIHFQDCKFQSLDSLEYADAETLLIRNSGVSDIADGAFAAMTKLEVLDLSNNKLSVVKATMFEGLEEVHRLTLTNNDLTSIGPKSFSSLPKLQFLDLSLNNPLQLDDDAFADHTALNHVNMITCGLTSIPSTPLGKITLKSLNVDRNDLGSLPDDSFSSLTSLEELHLDSCQLGEISEDLFNNLKNLHTLDLGFNDLETIPDDAFEDSRDALRVFYVESNKLETLSEELLDWGKLTKAMFGHNPWMCDCDLTWMTDMDLLHVDKENVTCAGPEQFEKALISNLTTKAICPCGGGDCGGTSVVVLAIAIPIVIICVLLIGYYIYKIIQNRRLRGDRKSGVRYSAVYKDTTEATPKNGAMAQQGGGAPTSVL